ncbi:MAG: N-acetylmuramoyl-L-alanine amidase, partial [Muribaculaceae bacterium]|nr:N-acetylmuramoyl-L-alanine amidase [Muribaculaceae bacterium]
MMKTVRLISLTILMVLFMAAPNISAANKNKDKDKITIVLDPGHGGKDFGACENDAKEKDINLSVAKKLRDMIEKELKDEVNVVMTRSSDVYLTLQERADIANNAGGDLFMSIHVNSIDKKTNGRQYTKGSSVYVLGLHRDQDNMKVAMRENSVIELESDYKEKYSGFDPSKDESYIIFEMAQKRNLGESIRVASDAQ